MNPEIKYKLELQPLKNIMRKANHQLCVAENHQENIHDLNRLIKKDYKQMIERLEDTSLTDRHELILDFYFKIIHQSFEELQNHISNYIEEHKDVYKS